MNKMHDVELSLTTAQRGLWVGHKIGAADATMNLAEAVDIHGVVDVPVFLEALRRLTVEIDALRVNVVERGGRPIQVVRADYGHSFPYLDLRADTDPSTAAEAWMMRELTAPVDMAHDPLWVSALFRLGEQHYLWYQRAHHVVFDGYSGGMAARRLMELYNAGVEGRAPQSADFLPLQTLVEAEADYRSSERMQRDRRYWMEQLAQLPEAVTLARGGRRRSMGGLRRSSGYLDAALARRLEGLGQPVSASLPQVLIGLVAAYYHRVTGAFDLVMGMPVSGRLNRTLRRTPGMVANAVAVRLRFEVDTHAQALFEQVSRVVRQSLRHQQYRYEDLRRDLGLVGQDQHIAWLGVNIEPFDYQLSFGGAKAVPRNMSNGSAEDLTVFVYDRGDGGGLRFDFDANPALYSSAELDRHRDRLLRLIDGVLDAPQQPLRDIDVLGAEERQRLLEAWNDTAQACPLDSLPAQVARQAAATPDAVAVMHGDERLSYRQLHARSVGLARRLRADGVKPGDRVAVALPRDQRLPVVLLAIMRTGAAYLPLDLHGPAERNAMVLDDAAPAAIITLAAWSHQVARDDLPVLSPDIGEADLDAAGEQLAIDDATPHRAAYVLFTSGSTGRPKGVEVSHRNLGHFLHAMRRQVAPSAGDRFLAVTTLLFDIAALELYLPLTVGARVVIADGDSVRQPPLLARMISDYGITQLQATPSLWRVLLSCAETRLDGVHAMVGGEALDVELARRMHRMAARLTQFYGPTETTVWSTACDIDAVGTEAPPIGRPLPNTRVYVLDDAQRPVPTGAVGELYIGGEGVAMGYVGRPQLNAQRFLADPFAGQGRMYRSGDRVRWREDGMLEFVGRLDHQIKIRGHRVELGEIEQRLAAHPAVAAAAVTAQHSGDGTVSLVGYLLAAEERAALDMQSLRAHLHSGLPDYMVPARMMVLESWPLTANGKLDRSALPSPEAAAAASAEYVAPVGEVETKLAALWQALLGVERVGRHDNFFELGGDSLAAAEMIARFPEHFAVELPLGSLFEAATVAGLAGYLQRAGSRNDPLGVVLPLRATSSQRPLFCVHPVVGLSWGYSGLLRHLDAGVPLYGLQSRGLRGDAELPRSIEAIAADYLQQIRRIQPRGPYRLLGWSMGGLIAHALAAQLQAHNERVELLGIMDAYPFVSVDGRPGDEARDVLAALHFLGLRRLAATQPPRSMAALAELLCREYDVLSVPLVQEIMKQDAQLIDHVSAVTRNNLVLARRYAPRRVEADMVYFHATVKEDVDLRDILNHHPSAWHPYVGGQFEVHDIDCHHQAMLEEAAVAHIGGVLRQKLRMLEAPPAARPEPVPVTADGADIPVHA